MHALKLLHKHLNRSCKTVNKKRISSVMMAVEGLILGESLSVTGLGRELTGKPDVKHKIKRVDRLVGNEKIHEEIEVFYGATTKLLLAAKREVVVIVDWSPCGNIKHSMLSASLVGDGRPLPLYQQVHPEKNVNSSKVEEEFLNKLYQLIPTSCKVTIVTDAGFKTPWFKHIESLGWDWVGRIRSNMLFKKEKTQRWNGCIPMRKNMKYGKYSFGVVKLSKKHQHDCHLFGYKGKLKGLKRKNKYGGVSKQTMSLLNSEAQREGWLLGSSLANRSKVIKIYKTRMQIELMFRDLKSERNGFKLNQHGTRSPERLSVLVMIGALTAIILWLVGKAAENKGLQYAFQANTVKSKRVLSLVTLGKQVIKHRIRSLTWPDIKAALTEFQDAACLGSEPL